MWDRGWGVNLRKILVPTFAAPLPEHLSDITDVEGQMVGLRESIHAVEYYRCADVEALMAEIRVAVDAERGLSPRFHLEYYSDREERLHAQAVAVTDKLLADGTP